MREEPMTLQAALEEMRKASLFKRPLVAETALLATVVPIEQRVGERQAPPGPGQVGAWMRAWRADPTGKRAIFTQYWPGVDLC